MTYPKVEDLSRNDAMMPCRHSLAIDEVTEIILFRLLIGKPVLTSCSPQVPVIRIMVAAANSRRTQRRPGAIRAWG